MFWTDRQRLALSATLAVILIILFIRLRRDNSHIPDPMPQPGARAAELRRQMDPNTADWTDLASIPGLRESLAREIVRYRERCQSENPDRPAFTRPEDLRRVKGIGQTTLRNLQPYLLFPQSDPDEPTTRK